MKEILQRLTTGRVSNAEANTIRCRSLSYHHWSLAGIKQDLLISSNVASFPSNGNSFWSTMRRYHGHQNNGPDRARSFWCSFHVYQPLQRNSHVLRWALAASHAILWDSHAMSDITDTKKLKAFLPLWKSHWNPSTKWLRNQSYLKPSISSRSDAPSSLSFTMSSVLNGCKQAQRKLILNSPPAKPHSKKADPC